MVLSICALRPVDITTCTTHPSIHAGLIQFVNFVPVNATCAVAATSSRRQPPGVLGECADRLLIAFVARPPSDALSISISDEDPVIYAFARSETNY